MSRTDEQAVEVGERIVALAFVRGGLMSLPALQAIGEHETVSRAVGRTDKMIADKDLCNFAGRRTYGYRINVRRIRQLISIASNMRRTSA